MSAILDERLFEDALWMVLIHLQPNDNLLPHSDCGSQYTSRSNKVVLAHYKIELSIICKANCGDNAAIEKGVGEVLSIIFASEDEAGTKAPTTCL